MRFFYIAILLIINTYGVSGAVEQTSVIEYIQELTGKVDELTKIIADLQKRIDAVESTLLQKTVSPQTIVNQQDQGLSAPPKITLKKARPNVDADHLWDSALCALEQKQLETAEQYFADFVHFYPKHPHASEAQYWLGEIQLINKKYAQAQIYYALAYKSLSESNPRKADTGLKIAECYFALNKVKEGCLFLKEIMQLQQKGNNISTATLQLMEQFWSKYKCADL
jgi:TolA-binding protein